MPELPATNNYYSFFEDRSIDSIYDMLVNNGWAGHRSRYDDCRLTDEESELELYNTNGGALLNGRLMNATHKYQTIVQLFKNNGFGFTAELYDENKALLMQGSF